MRGTSIGLNKTGSGTAVLSGANTYTGLTTVACGTLELGPAAQNAVFNLGGADVQGGRLVFDYNGGISPAATIESLLTDSYDGGLWDVGQFRNSTAASSGLTLGWLDDGSSKVTVMATYAGDFNLDGVVNDADLDVWTSNSGIGTAWQMGDANYDGVVNGLDYDLWQQNVGKTAPAGGDSLAAPALSDSGAWNPGDVGRRIDWLCLPTPGESEGRCRAYIACVAMQES